MLNLLTENLDIEQSKENFLKIADFVLNHPILGGEFKMIEVEVLNPTSTYTVYHRLGFKPKDVIITYISQGTATPLYGSFTRDTLQLNVSSASTIRLLIGKFKT